MQPFLAAHTVLAGINFREDVRMVDAGMDDGTRRTLLWLRRVRNLPPFPPVVREALAILEDDRSSARDVARIVNRDEAIAARVLRLVNSAFYGVRGKATTISRAVTLLGFEQIRALMIGVALFDQTWARDPVAERNRRVLWEHAIACARWARELAVLTRYEQLDEASLAGLLHDVGKIALGVSCPREFAASVALSHSEGTPSYEAEHRVLGIDHLETGGMVSEHWRLPFMVRGVVALHHGPWPPRLDESAPEPRRLRHLLAIVRVANDAGKQSLSERPPGEDAGEFQIAISPEELIERALQVDALLAG